MYYHSYHIKGTLATVTEHYIVTEAFTLPGHSSKQCYLQPTFVTLNGGLLILNISKKSQQNIWKYTK